MAIPTINRPASTNQVNILPPFPDDIGENTLTISIYDTTNSDMVNAGLDGAADEILGIIKTAYGDVKSAASGGPTTGSAGNKKLNKSLIGGISLPFPNSISESLSHTYEDEKGWVNDVPGVGMTLSAADAMLSGPASSVAKMTGSQAYKYYENKIAMYQSTASRSISLQWNLVPYNAIEARNLHEIVRTLKMYSSPKLLAGKLILRSPHFFKLTFANSVLDEALQFNEVNIVDIAVEYSPGGAMETFKDDMPKSVDLTITFNDREPKTHEDWDGDSTEEVVGETC